MAPSFRNVTTSPLFSSLTSLAAAGGFSGTFELHLTVPSLDPQAQAHFTEICRLLGVKPILILAPGARMALQPMTSSYLQGSIEVVSENTLVLLERLTSEGFPPLRCKLEATLGSQGVPEEDTDADDLPGRYFEFHAKVVLGTDEELARLRARCVDLGAHLSSNAFRRRPDGLQERFLTLRAHRVGRRTALARFRTLLGALREDGYAPGHLLHEYSVLDTNSLLDQGWLALTFLRPQPRSLRVVGREPPDRDCLYMFSMEEFFSVAVRGAR